MRRKTRHPELLRLKFNFKNPLGRKLLSPSAHVIERLFLLDRIEDLYENALHYQDDADFMHRVLKVLNVTYELSAEDLARFPKTGPAIVVANHPYGGIEAIIMCAVLHSVRTDSRVMANFLLSRLPEVHKFCIFVDPFGSRQSSKTNIGPIKEVAHLLKNGGMLGMFPAGEVSHMSLRGQGIVDGAWSPTVARIIRMAQAPVIPMFIEGANGPFFQFAGLLHPKLRTAMLPHELLNKKNRTIRLNVGNPIPFDKLDGYSKDKDMMEYLKFRTYVLPNRNITREERRKRLFRRRKPARQDIIAPAVNPDLMAAEIAQLAPEQKLTESGPMEVYYGRAQQLRYVLDEIGRLREITFREEGEGTGQSRDLDRFDEHYLHLFMWNRDKLEIAGAYRIGLTDELMKKFGKKGLYTSTLFKYKPKLIRRLSPALEMGRSFIRLEYQKNFTSLLLLWKGIGLFIVNNPQYTRLFGPVSISSEYRSVSRRLLAAYLKVNNFEADLSKLIKARHPLRAKPIKGCASTIFGTAVKDVDTISNVIAEIEGNERGIPILLKQYLRLGGRLLGFSVDPDFGNVLDGLILVDMVHLCRTDRKQLQRFMGKEGIESFARHHGIDREPEWLTGSTPRPE